MKDSINVQIGIVIQTDVLWPCFKCKQTTVILYSVKKDLTPRCTIMQFANRNLTRQCTIMRFANRTQFPRQNGVEAEKLVKTVRFNQRRLIEN